MDKSKDLNPNTEGIMYVMHELKEKKCTDNTLLSNLDFAEGFLKDHPLNLTSKLLVKGNWSHVKIGSSTSRVFTVSSDNDHNTHLNLHIQCINKVHKSWIEEWHFFGHSCQDEIKSCFIQAKEAISQNGLDKLMIKCNRFSITYSSSSSGSNFKTVETKCQFKLETITVEGLLERKSWLQKEKSTCHDLIACLDHLIKLYLTTPDPPKNNCRFIIHADKQIVRIVSASDLNEKEYVLLCDNDKVVSMYPQKWQ